MEIKINPKTELIRLTKIVPLANKHQECPWLIGERIKPYGNIVICMNVCRASKNNPWGCPERLPGWFRSSLIISETLDKPVPGATTIITRNSTYVLTHEDSPTQR